MRKTLIYSIVIMLITLSCKAQEIDRESLNGTFYGIDKGKDFSTAYTVELKEDGSFSLMIKVQDANPQCKGKWEISDNEVLLDCEKVTDPTKMISSAYMNKREYNLSILNKNKLKYKDTILKRKK